MVPPESFDAFYLREVKRRWILFFLVAVFPAIAFAVVLCLTYPWDPWGVSVVVALVPALGWLAVPLLYFVLGLWGARHCQTDVGRQGAAAVVRTAANWMVIVLVMWLATLAVPVAWFIAERAAGTINIGGSPPVLPLPPGP